MIDQTLIDKMTANEADMAFKKRVQTIFDWMGLRDDSVILDIPCGRGFYLNMIRYVNQQCTIVGAELDWEIVQKARDNLAHIPDISIHNANIYTLPYADNTFDVVILSEILEHLDDDVAGLREAWRVLKPNGVAIITVPNANYPFWWDPINKSLEVLLNTHISNGTFAGIWANHVRLYSMDELRASVTDANFEIEEERSFTHSSFPFIHNIVYGFGKPLLESGLLPDSIDSAANRLTFDQNDGSLRNPMNVALRVLNYFDRNNALNETSDRSTVNLAIKGRKPA